MNPDKTAIEKLWETHSFDYYEPDSSDPVRVMIKDDFLAALQKAKAERDDYKCRWWRAHGELMIALGAPMTDRQNTAMKEISETPDSKILEVLREQ